MSFIKETTVSEVGTLCMKGIVASCYLKETEPLNVDRILGTVQEGTYAHESYSYIRQIVGSCFASASFRQEEYMLDPPSTSWTPILVT